MHLYCPYRFILHCFRFQVGLALVATCFVLMCYHTNPEINEMPFWMRYYIIERLGKRLGITALKPTENTPNNETTGPPPVRTDQLRSFIMGKRLGQRTESNVSAFVNRKTSVASCKICESRTAATKSLAGSSHPGSMFVSPSTIFGDDESVYTVDVQMDNSIERNIRQPKGCASRDKYMGMLGAIIHRQDHLVEGLRKLGDNQDEIDKQEADRFQWILAAHIIDRFFLLCFVATLFISILMIFAMVPHHPDIDEILQSSK